jgi:RNA-binding protein Musashi
MPVPVDAMLSGPMANLGLTDPAAPQPVLAPPPAAQAEDKKLRYHRTPPTEHDCRKLFVGGLPTDVTDHAFLDYFTQFGQVIDSVVMVDRVTKRSRGFGFVTFANENDAAKLLTAIPGKTGYVMINGKQCEVKASTPKMEDASPKHSHHGSVGMWKSHHNNHRHVNRGYNQRHHNNGHHTGHGKHMFHHHQPHDDKHIYRDDQFVGDVDGRNFDQVYAQQPLTNPSYQAMNAYDRSMNTSNMSMYNHNYQSHYHGAVTPGYGYSGGSTASSVPSSWEASYPAPAQGYGQYPTDNMSQGNTGYYTNYDPQYPNQYTGPSYGNNSMPPSMMGHPAYSSYGSFPVEGDGPAATPGAGTSGFEPCPQSYDGDGNYDQTDNQYE